METRRADELATTMGDGVNCECAKLGHFFCSNARARSSAQHNQQTSDRMRARALTIECARHVRVVENFAESRLVCSCRVRCVNSRAHALAIDEMSDERWRHSRRRDLLARLPIFEGIRDASERLGDHSSCCNISALCVLARSSASAQCATRRYTLR